MFAVEQGDKIVVFCNVCEKQLRYANESDLKVIQKSKQVNSECHFCSFECGHNYYSKSAQKKETRTHGRS